MGQSPKYDSMRELVGAEKADVLNSGYVKDSAGQSKSTLVERKNALGIRARKPGSQWSSSKGARRGASTVGTRAAHPVGSESRGHEEEGGRNPVRVSAEGSFASAEMGFSSDQSDGTSLVLPLSAYSMADSVIADELDESEEFNGVAKVNRGYSSARRLARRFGKQADQEAGVSSTSKASGAAETKGSRRAQLRKAKKAERAKAAQRSAAVASEAHQAAAAASSAAKGKGTIAAIGSAVSAAAAPIGAVILGVIAFIMLVLAISQLLSALFGFWQNEHDKNMGQLVGVEAEIAQYLRAKDFTDEAIAAVLGNAKAESGMNPALEEDLSGQWNAYEVNCGLFCYTSTSRGAGEYWEFKEWCSSSGKDWATVATQMEWTFDGSQPSGYWANRWSGALARSGYYSNCPGYPGSSYYDASDFPKADDVEKATFSWMACYERPQNGSASHLDKRIEYAKEYLSLLKSGAYEGGDGIVAAAMSKLGCSYVWGAKGPNEFDCSGFTSWCYAQIGFYLPAYSEDQYDVLRPIPISQAKPGDVLYKRGHVGIYVGDGKSIEAMGRNYGVCYGSASRYTCALTR